MRGKSGFLLILCLITGLPASSAGADGAGLSASSAGTDGWLLVDTAAMTVTLMRGTTPATVFGDIAIGQDGATRHKIRNDQRTPLGAYHVSEIRQQSRFHRFIALDYPSLDNAREALQAGIIDRQAFDRIRMAHEHGRLPPSDTPLGGEIGIHGVGDGDIRFHHDYNWTDGCIALTDEQIDRLIPDVTPGMAVIIR